MKTWCALFSQTGSEIHKLSKLMNRLPDRIICNKSLSRLDEINFDLLQVAFDRMYFVQGTPTIEEYRGVIPENSVVTLHGYLRIVPEQICNDYEIYNLHPAPLTLYPELKGKDPQARIAQHGYEYCGNTIHRCTPVLDSGEIILEEKYPNNKYTVQQVIEVSHNNATNLWFNLLKGII